MGYEPDSALWVLRRWNSFSPRIPSIDSGPGGGYFLKWMGRGVAIDPGFDYLINMQKAGIQLGDVNAIAVTHSHPDHTCDVEPLLMMMAKRVERMQAHGLGGGRPLDLFLSKDTARKYNRLIEQQNHLVVNQARSPELDRQGTEELPDYYMKIQTLPANHMKEQPLHAEDSPDPVRNALSMIFHLYSERNLSDSCRCISIGFTGDTRYNEQLVQDMKDCEVVIAHLGSVDFGSLMRVAALRDNRRSPKRLGKLHTGNLKPEEEEAFRDLLGIRKQPEVSVIAELDDILEGKETGGAGYQSGHLLYEGILDLFASLFGDEDARTRIGIISEFGRELGSFRHKVAEAINVALLGSPDGTPERRVISGDKDLAISLSKAKQTCAHWTVGQCKKAGECHKDEAQLLFRCTLCHEWVCLSCIKEHSIKYYDQGIFYNCDLDWRPSYYPRLRLIDL